MKRFFMSTHAQSAAVLVALVDDFFYVFRMTIQENSSYIAVVVHYIHC